ncbi:MAG TPA: NapC/NirT family cytochrome c [Candidatus Methylomirabilis sp.]|nr:NapC/NirT family cytochrome c [Candidatus Methylomirabilis sp.]
MGERETGAETPGKNRKGALLEKIGMHVPEGKHDRLHIQPRFFKFLGFLGILFLIFSVGMFEFSTSPYFCASCHIMKPYYQAWKTSKHNHVPCVDCHYPPDVRDKMILKFQALSQVAKYVTRTYSSKPYAEISDESCLRKGCHETRLLQGTVTFKRGIMFDHKPHLTDMKRGKKLRCTSCHSQIVVGNHMEVTESTCFLCHFRGAVVGREMNPIGGCGDKCHKAPEKDIKFGTMTFNHKDFVGSRHVACQNCHLDAIQGSGEAKKERCFQCHNDEKRLSRFTDIDFMHKQHVTDKKVDCMHCHEAIKHAVKTSMEPLHFDCNVCHERKHNIQKQIYQGIGARGVPNRPSPMFLTNVDCPACHYVRKMGAEAAGFLGQTYRAGEDGCIKCHGEDFRGILDEWHKTLQDAVAAAKPAVDKARVIARAGKGNARAVQLAKDAEYNFLLVQYGHGVHNVEYAVDVLDKAKADAEAALAASKK